MSQDSDKGDDLPIQPGPPILREPAPQHQPSQLARLPHELLVQILEPILAQDAPLLLLPKARFVRTTTAKKSKTSSTRRSPLVSILLACRAMYFAGVDVFYGRNTLDFVEALHMRRLVGTRLGHDQRWSVTAVRLNVAWIRKGRQRSGGGSRWLPLHECDAGAAWRDVLDALPRLRRVVVRSVTTFDRADLVAQVDVAAFEANMREEVGPDRAGLLEFVWPLGGSGAE